MFKIIGWIVAIAALIYAISGGVSLMDRPEFEVSYEPSFVAAPCFKDSCITLYELSVGNTGRKLQDDVVVFLSPSALDDALLPVEVSGKTNRQNIIHNESGTEVHLGEIEPGHQKLLRFTLSVPKSSPTHKWSELLTRVSPTRGIAREGSPHLTRLGRFMVGFFGLCI